MRRELVYANDLGYRRSNGYKHGARGTWSWKNTSSTFRPNRIKYRDIYRDEITRVPKDDTGWRKPTAYKAHGHTVVPPVASVYATSERQWDPPYEDYTDEYIHVHSGNVASTSNSTYGWIKMSCFGSPVYNLGSYFDSYQNKSLIKARNAIADRRASFGEAIAELSEGVSDLRKFFGKNARVLRGIAARDPKQVLREFRSTPYKPTKKQAAEVKRVVGNKVRAPAQHLSESLMAIEWGLSPMISDAHDLVRLLEGNLLSGTLRVNGKSSVYEPVSRSASSSSGLSTGYTTWSRETDEFGRVGVYTSLWYDIDVSSVRNLTQLGLADIPQVTWAVLPGSFLVDWVIPVSSWLKSLTATLGLTYKGGSSTAFGRHTHITRLNYQGTTLPGILKSCDIQQQAEVVRYFAMERRVHPSEPIPRLPGIRDPFGAYQAVMSAALLGAQIKTLPALPQKRKR